MDKAENYININRNTWNTRTEYHVASDFYDMPSFIAGKSSLNTIELELLGNVKHKKILHLQCHFGQDTISLARMGAIVTGVDFSDKAIETARKLAVTTGTNAQFICCDVYDLPNHLDGQFDIVFTTYGTIGWLPNLKRWAEIVSKYLKPDGRFVFAEFHPVVWTFDNNFDKVAYNYFKDDAIIETEEGTYANKNAPIVNESISWNHSLSEVMMNLINTGLSINIFKEYNYSPYNCFSNMEEYEPGKFRIIKFGNKIPLVYSLMVTKPY